MNQRPFRFHTRVLLVLAAFGLYPSATMHAQSGGGFHVQRATIDSGGGTSAAAGWSLTGTIGQPDVGAASAPGLEFRGGFWASTAPPSSDQLLRDGFESP